MTDTIVAEVREIRAQLAARFDYDLKRIFDDVMAREKAALVAAGESLPEGAAALPEVPRKQAIAG